MQETPKAADAYRRYVALGSTRTLEKLAHQLHQESPGRKPQTILRVLKGWSAEHDWQGRLARIAAQQREDAEFAERERVRQILNSGLALTHERVGMLKGIAEILYGDLTTDRKRFIRRGKFGDEHFNAGEVRALLATLDDLAKETGGRQVVKDEQTVDGDDNRRRIALLSDDERARRVEQLLGAARARRDGSAIGSAGPPA